MLGRRFREGRLADNPAGAAPTLQLSIVQYWKSRNTRAGWPEAPHRRFASAS
jgi:hypothetical protein